MKPRVLLGCFAQHPAFPGRLLCAPRLRRASLQPCAAQSYAEQHAKNVVLIVGPRPFVLHSGHGRAIDHIQGMHLQKHVMSRMLRVEGNMRSSHRRAAPGHAMSQGF